MERTHRKLACDLAPIAALAASALLLCILMREGGPSGSNLGMISRERISVSKTCDRLQVGSQTILNAGEPLSALVRSGVIAERDVEDWRGPLEFLDLPNGLRIYFKMNERREYLLARVFFKRVDKP